MPRINGNYEQNDDALQEIMAAGAATSSASSQVINIINLLVDANIVDVDGCIDLSSCNVKICKQQKK